ncbi:MAG: biotin/lipoate A/B protein ligase family protein [Armatimonadota bacterium]
MDWRIISYGEYDKAWNMAVDEAIFDAFIKGDVPPTIRFYGWLEQSITVGRLQPIDTVPEGWGNNIVRRPTGGRGVYHGKDLTFSIVVSAAAFGSPIKESYKRVGKAVAKALVAKGVSAELCRNTTPPSAVRGIGDCFNLTLDYELAVEGKKTLGSAQVRRSGAVLQQNSLQSPSGERWNDVSGLIGAIVKSLESEFGEKMDIGNLTENEIKNAQEFADNKYTNDDWNRLGSLQAKPAL